MVVSGHRSSGSDGGRTPADRYAGFGSLLYRWRKDARVTQVQAGRALGMGERTYRDLEKGATPPRFTPAQCESLSTLLGLDTEERHALLLHNIGTNLIPPRGAGHPQLQQALRLLIDLQMPSPAYLCDQHWNIIAFNTVMAEWWPWVMRPGANLILWALTSTEARTQYQDWDQHASAYVRMLKFAEAVRANDGKLRELIETVKKAPDARRIWETEMAMGETRDGHDFRMNVPALGWQTVEVVSHVLYPASMPECRFVVITCVKGAEAESGAFGGARDAWAATTAGQEDVEATQWHTQNRLAEAAAVRRQREPAAFERRRFVGSAAEAAALAGKHSVSMPAISAVVGPGVQLTLAPEQRSVVWAVKEAPGSWSVTQVTPATVVAGIPRDVMLGGCLPEVLQLVRAAMPTQDEAAAARVKQLLHERTVEQQLLQKVLHMIEGVGTGEPDDLQPD
ncbi:helix-turn-helix transcriptional regulator [Streptomyces alfalfae]|nr:helix-turn-helix transcriptional regulator [Streptomyces alfalfae]